MNQLIQPRCWDFHNKKMSKVTMILFPTEEIDEESNMGEPKMAYHFDIMYPIDVLDSNKKMMYVGDIVTWPSGVYSLENVQDNVKNHANKSYDNWLSSDRSEEYDFEGNGWELQMKIGVIVKYHGQNCIHDEYDVSNHENTSFYNGTSYYGPVQHKTYYKIIGNIHETPYLLTKNDGK